MIVSIDKTTGIDGITMATIPIRHKRHFLEGIAPASPGGVAQDDVAVILHARYFRAEPPGGITVSVEAGAAVQYAAVTAAYVNGIEVLDVARAAVCKRPQHFSAVTLGSVNLNH